ncbi:hypothetical protein [Lysinibacillus sp. NPDC093216]|uniref:hypothetical protein n=1 Tax=Lysinibacillus sp. NPDC093216 TaxID=3390576 RepID=UPI003CFC0D77
MRIYFQDWIHNQNFSERSLDLFEEAILCYRATAYKGALLFSFLGFQNIIRERVLRADLPHNAIQFQSKWDEIQGKLRDEDQSDAQVITCISMQKPFTIFSISTDVKEQYLYWKNRRNDCAHGKGNTIKDSHVESFWFFIESNLVKFNVNGSFTFIKDKVKKHFDTLVTPSGTKPDNVISQIPNSLSSQEFNEFLTQLNEYLCVKRTFAYNDPDVQAFYLTLFDQLPKEYLTELKNFMKDNLQLLVNLLNVKPSLIYEFKNDPDLIRLIWKSKLKGYSSHYAIIAKMLQFELIPEEQLNEFVMSVSENLSDNYFTFSDERRIDLQILNDKGFIKNLGDIAFSQFPKINKFNWARENKYLICCYLVEYNFNENVVRALYTEFSREHYPNQLGKVLLALFDEQPELYSDYLKAAKLYDVEIPQYFKQNDC